MTFTWPTLLWLLLLVPLMLLGLRFSAQRRARSAERFADAHLLPTVLKKTRRTRWPTALQMVALSLLLLAASRPVASPPLPINKAAVVIALDASRSMLAEDVDPSRLERARELARAFAEQVPATTQIGLVSFSDTASVLVPPTRDRDELYAAIDQVEPARNTSLASAVVTGVRMLPGRKTIPSPQELEPPGFGPTLPTIPLDELDKELEQAQDPPPGSILIFSDGVSNVGNNPDLSVDNELNIAAKFASENAVKLYTIALGQTGGTVTRIDGEDFFIPFEPDNLARLAERSEGDVIDPEDEGAVAGIIRDLGTVIRWEPTRMEISSLLVGLATIFMLIAGAMSLRMSRRVP